MPATPPGRSTPDTAAEASLTVNSKSRSAARFADLEGQRGLAAVLVVVFHAYQYDRTGQAGIHPYEGSAQNVFFLGLDGMVSWFFVLSAFLLALPYVRAVLDGRPATSARTFLARRAVRIVPLYLIAVSVVWAWRNPTLPGDWRDLVEHLTFTQVFDQQRIFYTIGPAWSLAVEVQFYVLLAALGALAARAGLRMPRRRSRLALLWAGTASLAVLSVGYSAYAAVVLERPAEDFHIWFSLPAKLVVFAAGIAVAIWYASHPRTLAGPLVLALRLAALAVVGGAMVSRRDSGGGDALFHGLVGLGFALLVLASVQGPQRGLWHRAFSSRVAVWSGLVSYSLYLWHEPLLLSLAGVGLIPEPSAEAFPLTAAVLVVSGLLVAWVSYWTIEWPFSHLRTRIDGRPSVPITHRRRE